jgi:hypothetical protein
MGVVTGASVRVVAAIGAGFEVGGWGGLVEGGGAFEESVAREVVERTEVATAAGVAAGAFEDELAVAARTRTAVEDAFGTFGPFGAAVAEGRAEAAFDEVGTGPRVRAAAVFGAGGGGGARVGAR